MTDAASPVPKLSELGRADPYAKPKEQFMTDRDDKDGKDNHQADKPTKPAGQQVGPPEERVDDEVGSDEAKTTKRQE